MKKMVALLASAALLLAMVPSQLLADTVITPTFTYASIDGQVIPHDQEASGDGWYYNPASKSIILNGYVGGPIIMKKGNDNPMGYRIEVIGSHNVIDAEGADAGIYSDCGTTLMFLNPGSTLNIKGNVKLGGIINTQGDLDLCTTNQRLKNIEGLQESGDFQSEFNKDPVAPESADALDIPSDPNVAIVNIDVSGDGIAGIAAGSGEYSGGQLFLREKLGLNLNVKGGDSKENIGLAGSKIHLKSDNYININMEGTFARALKDSHGYSTRLSEDSVYAIKAPSVFGTEATPERWTELFGGGQYKAEGEVRNAPADFKIVYGVGSLTILDDGTPYVGPGSAVNPPAEPGTDTPTTPTTPATPGVTPAAPTTPTAPTVGVAKLDLVINSTAVVGDGKSIPCDAAPYIEQGRTMVPLRVVAEAFGCDVQWDGDSRSITIVSPAQTLIFIVGSTTYTQIIPGQSPVAKTIDVAPMIQKSTNRTFIPIRFVGEAFGYDASYTTNAQGLAENITFVRK